MKKIFISILTLLLILSFNSCASNQVVDKSTVTNKEKKQKEEKLRFDDWKYKGFGQELPEWIENAINGNNVNLKKYLSKMYNVTEVQALVGEGENSDQAEQAAKMLAEQLLSEDGDYVLYDSFWVREDNSVKQIEMPYKSVYVYYKE